MDVVRVAVLGAGSVRCAPAVLASLATYFGERKLEIRLFDADEERLDLFDLLGRSFFAAMKSTHTLRSTVDPTEALEDADRVILMMDENCVAKCLKQGSSVDRVLQLVPEGALVLSLEANNSQSPIEWPGEVPDGNTIAVAHECLRIARGEENPFPYLKRHERSPLRDWLEAALV